MVAGIRNAGFALVLAAGTGMFYPLAGKALPADSLPPRILPLRPALSLLKPLVNRWAGSEIGRFWVNGEFNPYVVYRKMDEAYAGTYGGAENLSFAPYPNLLSPTVNTLQPTLVLRVGGTDTAGISWEVDYAFFYRYDSDQRHRLSFLGQNNLVTRLETRFPGYRLRLQAGAGVMPVHFSRLILSNRYIREGLFDRVPWEYHAGSALRSEAAFQESVFSPSLYDKAASQGFLAGWEGRRWSGKFFAGRTQLQLFPDGLDRQLPALVYAGRTELRMGHGWKAGSQVYHSRQALNPRDGARDFRTLFSADAEWQGKNWNIQGETGVAGLSNPIDGRAFGLGAVGRVNFPGKPVSFRIQAFGIGRNFVCLESEVYNANPLYRQGGLLADSAYNNFLYPAYLNPAGSLVNNRAGIDLEAEKKNRHLSVSLGQQISREIVYGGNTISFPHMLNGFSRSRFSPWQQYTGPYGRIGNRFRMSLEKVRVHGNSTAPRWFSSGYLDFRLRLPAGRQWASLFSRTAWASAGAGPGSGLFSPESGLLRSLLQEFDLMVPLARGLFVVATAGWEQNQASSGTALSPETGRPLNQRGRGFGLGLDWDWASNAGLCLRHRWLQHRDLSFLADRFSGTETVVEIKIGF